MRLKHLLLALPLSFSVVAASPPAYTDDVTPAPKKVRVRLKRVPGKDAPSAQRRLEVPAAKSPMTVIRTWLMGKVGESMAGAGAKKDRLGAWFDGGADVPLVGLRDALKADGWTAPTLKLWIMGEVARVGSPMMQLFAARGAQHGIPPSMFFGQRAPHGRSAHHGQHAHHGRSAHHRQHTHHEHGRRAGPGGRRGFQPGNARGGRRGNRGHGMRRRGMRRRGVRQRGNHGHAFGGMGQPQIQTEQRTIILWNDGSGWQRKTVPGGMPGMGHGQARTPFGMHGPSGMGWMPGHPGGGQPGQRGGPHAHGMGGPHGGRGHGGPGPQGPQAPVKQHPADFGALLKMFGGLQGKQGGVIDGAALRTLLKALKKHGAALGVDATGLRSATQKKSHIKARRLPDVKKDR